MSPQHLTARHEVTSKILVDSILVLIVALPIPIFHLVNTVQPLKRGFFCNDESLNHPYYDSSVPTALMIVIALLFPTLVILGVEIFLHMRYGRYSLNDLSCPRPKYIVAGRSVHSCLATLYTMAGPFLFGAALTQSVTDFIKYSVGRLRPHFLSVCNLNWEEIQCFSNNSLPLYVENYECENNDEHILKESRLSFPSGHASLSMYAAVYLVIYLQLRLTWKGSKILKPLIQSVLLYLAMYCGITRVSDYKHFFGDVVAGSLLGVLVAILVAYYVSPLLKSPRLHDILRRLKDMKRKDSATDGYSPNGTHCHYDHMLHSKLTSPLSQVRTASSSPVVQPQHM